MSIMTTNGQYQVIIIKTITHLEYLQRHPHKNNGDLPPYAYEEQQKQVI